MHIYIYIYIYIYTQLCLSLAGLKSHQPEYAKSILHPYNVTANETDRLCQFCGKICHSLLGLKSH